MPRIFNAVLKKLAQASALNEQGAAVALPGHVVRFNVQEQARVEALMRKFEANPFSPPGVTECKTDVGEEVLNALIEMGELTAVSAEVLFRTRDHEALTDAIRKALAQQGTISLAEVRDLFKTSRKYAQAVLEHLDTIGVTVRDGDFRRLRKP
jgi:selenocysteine-specific elongation factor